MQDHRTPPQGWWEAAFQALPQRCCRSDEMMLIIAYDITDPKRLAKVGRLCQEYGVRVQYSVFECRLEAAVFKSFWEELLELINPDEDRVVSYRVCMSCSREILTAGTMVSTQKVVAYVY